MQIVILSLDFRIKKNSIQFPALLLPVVWPWASHLPLLSHLWNGSPNSSCNLQACWRTKRANARRVSGRESALSWPGNLPLDVPGSTAKRRAWAAIRFSIHKLKLHRLLRITILITLTRERLEKMLSSRTSQVARDEQGTMAAMTSFQWIYWRVPEASLLGPLSACQWDENANIAIWVSLSKFVSFWSVFNSS